MKEVTTMPEEIIYMLDDFGFMYDVMGNYLMIKSKNDTWLIKYGCIFNKQRMRLYHLNTRKSTSKHYQTTVNDFHHCLAYIADHDNKNKLRK